VVALAAIGPKDEVEGMIAAQLLAAQNATMECYRRAMIPEQRFEGRGENLNQANKLSHTSVVAARPNILRRRRAAKHLPRHLLFVSWPIGCRPTGWVTSIPRRGVCWIGSGRGLRTRLSGAPPASMHPGPD
jgi:hypothetical protein